VSEKIKQQIKELKDKGIEVWSISKINSFTQCERQFYNSYVLKERGKQNVYGNLGGNLHSYIESIYLGEKEINGFKTSFNNAVIEGELLGIDFPSESIKNSFVNDIRHFIDNFNKLDGKFLLEEQILFKIGDYYVQGFIDVLRVYENEGNRELEVIDWKSSSKFTGDKLLHAGRQLVMYKLAIEEMTKHKVSEVKWNMMKYLWINTKQKNGKIRKKMVNRSKLIKEMREPFTKILKENGYDELEIDIYLDTASKTNTIKGLPDCITDIYSIEDCYLTYEVTEELVQELHDYVNNTIEMINSKDKNNPDEWTPIIEVDEKQSFYCNVLCGFRESCQSRLNYVKKNELTKKNKNGFGGFY